MSTMILAPNAPAMAIETALGEPALAALARAGAPVVVACCDTLAVLAMNAAAESIFGDTPERAARRLFQGSAPGARRLASLARTLVTDAAPRLERMRFFAGPTTEMLTLLCRRVSAGEAGALFVLAAPGLRAAAPVPAPSTPAVPDIESLVPSLTPTSAPSSAREATAAPSPRHRIVWRTDRDGRLIDATPAFGTWLSAPVHVTGRPFADILREAGADRADALIDALAAQATFTGISVAWPAADGEASACVEFGGVPIIAEQQFAGFRGYALVADAVAVETPSPDMVEAEPRDVPPPKLPANVVQLRPSPPPSPAMTREANALSNDERSAFDEIARSLSAGLTTTPDLDTVAPLSPLPDAVAPDSMRKIVDLVPIGILVSRGGVAIFANRTLLDLTGYPDVDALHDAGGLDRLFGGASVDASGDQALAVGLVDCDGETIPVDARMHTLQWDGLPATLISMRRALDHTVATRAKSLEQMLRERDGETRELHAILDTATDGVIVFGEDRRILSLNRAAEALFGCETADVRDQPLDALVSDESRAPLADYLAGVAGGGVASVMNDGRELLCKGPRGGVIPVFMTVGRLGAGDAPRFCAVLRDLTAWKNAEHGLTEARSEAERASAQKSEFLARISHEIRTPLNAILGFAEVIMDERLGPVGNERYREYMRDIHRSGEHVMSLVNDLLDLSKIEAGKMDMTFTAVDANSVVSECVALMQPQAARARVIIRLSLAPRLPKVVADDRALKQIVLNLLSNAVKYNDAGGQVIVSTARTDAGHAVLRIRDTGIGMSDSELQVALEPFGQISTSRPTTGTGLGLPLTKALVEANRAAFSVKSRKGEGTLVEIAFPPSRVMAE